MPKLDVERLSIQIRIGGTELKQAKNRDTNKIYSLKKEVVQLVTENKGERASMRIEEVIRLEDMIQAYEYLETFLDKLNYNLPLLAREEKCPEILMESVQSVMFAARNFGFKSLFEIDKILAKYYGKKFVAQVTTFHTEIEGEVSKVHADFKRKIEFQIPDKATTQYHLNVLLAEAGIEPDKNMHIERPPVQCVPQPPPPRSGGGSGGNGGLTQPSMAPPEIAPSLDMTITGAPPACGASDSRLEASGSHHDMPPIGPCDSGPEKASVPLSDNDLGKRSSPGLSDQQQAGHAGAFPKVPPVPRRTTDEIDNMLNQLKDL